MKKGLFVLFSTFLLAGCGASDGKVVHDTVTPVMNGTQQVDEKIDHTRAVYQTYLQGKPNDINAVKEVNDAAYDSDIAIDQLLSTIKATHMPEGISKQATKKISSYLNETHRTYTHYKHVQYDMVQHVNDRDASLAASIQQKLENAEKQKTKQKQVEAKLNRYIKKHH